MPNNNFGPINLYIIDYFKEKKDNGLNTYVSELGKALEQMSDIFLTYVWVNSKDTERRKERIDGTTHIFVPRFPRPADNRTSFDVHLANLLAGDIGNKENVLVHLNWINHCSLAWHIKQKINCKIVLTKHCIPWRDLVTVNYKEFYRLNSAFNNKQKAVFNVPQLHQEQINYENLDHIITVTQYAKENLELLFDVQPEKITVINNGIALDVTQSSDKSRAKLRQQYGFDPDEHIIIFAHVLHERKGIIDLVKIFEELLTKNKVQNTRLIIAGNGDATRVAETVKKYWAKITFTGNLSKSILYDFYRLSDIGIVPSYAEQCSYTAIEMMQFGLPVIVSDVEGLSEIVPDNCGMKIKVNFRKDGVSLDGKNLRQSLELLLKNSSLAKELAQNARVHASKNFSLEQMVNNTVAVFRNVLQAAPVSKHKEEHIPIQTIPGAPLVSVLMPCFNVSAYLKLCIDSILNQSYTNFELVIIDDGSKDSTVEIIKSYTDKRIRLLINKENRGISHTLNKGIKTVKGKYIARMDADDIMSRDRLAFQVDFLEKNTSYGMVGAWHEVIDSDGMVIKRLQRATESQHLKLQLYFNNPFIHSAITMRTELVKQFKYDPKFELCEDYDLWTRIAAVTEVANVPHYLLQYRIHNKNVSVSNPNLLKQNVLNLLSRELHKLGIKHTPAELALHAAISFGYGANYFNRDEKGKALSNWLDKVFSCSKLLDIYSQSKLNQYKKFVLKNYCCA